MSDSDNGDAAHDARGRDENDVENNHVFEQQEEEAEQDDEYTHPPVVREIIIDGESYGASNKFTEIQVREGLTNIPNYTFYHCVNLT